MIEGGDRDHEAAGDLCNRDAGIAQQSEGGGGDRVEAPIYAAAFK